MDRINKFLSKRPVKHRKLVTYRGKTHEITKDDMKMVRQYRGRKCLDKTFKLSRPLDLSFSAVPIDALPEKPKKDNTELFERKTLASFLRKPERKRTHVEKNIIADIWEEDTLETLRDYKQEWVYSIKTPYAGPIEDCRFTREFLEEELRRVYMDQFKPREVKQRSINDLLPKLPDASELRPFPEMVAKVWEVSGKKVFCGDFVYAIDGLALRVINLFYNKLVAEIELNEEASRVRANAKGDAFVASANRIYKVSNKQLVLFNEVKGGVKDFYVDNERIAILTSKMVLLYSIEEEAPGEPVLLKKFLTKYERPHRVKLFDGAVYAASANGLMVESETHGDIKTLSYVLDFTVRKENIFVINNLCRLMVIGKNFDVKKNILQPEMGKIVAVHNLLNLLAIVFSEEIGIYKSVDGTHVPVHTIKGRFKAVEWHDTMPWIYTATASRVFLFT